MYLFIQDLEECTHFFLLHKSPHHCLPRPYAAHSNSEKPTGRCLYMLCKWQPLSIPVPVALLCLEHSLLLLLLAYLILSHVKRSPVYAYAYFRHQCSGVQRRPPSKMRCCGRTRVPNLESHLRF